MKSRWIRGIVLAALGLSAAGAQAQAASPMPMHLKGGWQGERVSNTWALQIGALDAEGHFKGRLTYYGPVCSTDGTDVEGLMTRAALKFTVTISVKCGQFSFDLTEGSAHAYEGVIVGTSSPKPLKAFLDR